MQIEKEELNELLRKYRARLEIELNAKNPQPGVPLKSFAYQEFKRENLPRHLTIYEKLCNLSGKILNLKPDTKKAEEISRYIEICHLEATPSGTLSFSVLMPILLVIIGGLLSFALFKSMFFIVYFLLIGISLMVLLQKLPEFFANSWRLKASNQMVQCIFYTVTYMRHTSNLELAIDFSAQHLAPPLSLDMKKVLWDVETERFESVKESLDNYLESWRSWNLEFIEAFHLIEASLYEPSDTRRLDMIDKSLNVMLEETYEKMLHYSHELKSPITMLYMLGIILPVLGLVILPLVGSFMTSATLTPMMLAIYLATLYNITLPIAVYYLGQMTLSKRPTGYGDTDISEENPELKKYKNIVINFGGKEVLVNPAILCIFIGFVLFLVGISPLLIHAISPGFDVPFGPFHLMDYKKSMTGNDLIGPYGLGAAILSLFVPLGFGISLGLYFKLKSKNVIKIRENAKRLEREFASALFQLGNRIGDGIPAEIAFGKVAEVMRGTVSGDFFEMVSTNIRRAGMGLKEAIFNPKRGAAIYFPSNIIESSMKVLIESSKKGPKIASQTLINVSEYIQQIHRVNERLKDLMADLISDMKQQINVLAPAISGIVVGITSMIVSILVELSKQFGSLGESVEGSNLASFSNIFGDGIPTYYFQMIVGIYVIQIIFILTVMTNGIENGSDKLSERASLGDNLIRGALIYTFIAFVVMLVFNFISMAVLSTALNPAV